MNLKSRIGFESKCSVIARSIVLAFVIAVVSASCGGTKVVTASKTIVYREAIYNVSNTNVVTRKTVGVVGDDETIELGDMDKRGFNALRDQHGNVFVRQSFFLDDKEMVYQAQRVDSWSDFNRMAKRFDGAAKDVRKFLADGKKTQLRLD